MEVCMRTRMAVIFGMILGVLLTFASAYTYDSMTGRAANGLAPSAAEGRPPLVNWDVVNDDWSGIKDQLRTMVADIERGLKKLTG
jgi:hypothetical protein